MPEPLFTFEVDPPFTRSERRGILLMVVAAAIALGLVVYRIETMARASQGHQVNQEATHERR